MVEKILKWKSVALVWEMCDDDCEIELTIKTTHLKVIFYELMIILFLACTPGDEYKDE